ncbi:MAG: hypothetical protein P8Y68_17110 [Anaerolineales bacterium]|jgi:GGDEF domain-containing protein
MKNFRKAIIGLVIFLTVFFNIERLDIGTENTININTFVYAISIVAIFSAIISKRITEFPIIYGFVLWFFIYVVLKIYFLEGETIFDGGVELYLAITEVSFLTISLILGRYTAQLLFDLESTVENITLIGAGNRVKAFNEADEDIQLEIYRSRRFNAPLSIITIPVENGLDQIKLNTMIKEMHDDILKHYSVIRLAKVFKNNSRRTDTILVKMDEDQLVVIAPQTNKDEAVRLVSNLQEATRTDLNMNFQFSIRTFPEDGHTFEKLYKLTLDDIEFANRNTLYDS